MKQIKQKRKNRKNNANTKVPSMSPKRINFIKRFRRRVIRQANKEFQAQLRESEAISERKRMSAAKRRNRRGKIEKRVEFREDSNETFQNPRWIQDFDQNEREQQQFERQNQDPIQQQDWP